jgi:nucleoside-diphosphate-sugar epimerase
MRVFVAGGTGVIGRRLVPQLVARGHQVIATTTNAGKLGLLGQVKTEEDPLEVAEDTKAINHLEADSRVAGPAIGRRDGREDDDRRAWLLQHQGQA